jgi:hypothetical protein
MHALFLVFEDLLQPHEASKWASHPAAAATPIVKWLGDLRKDAYLEKFVSTQSKEICIIDRNGRSFSSKN